MQFLTVSFVLSSLLLGSTIATPVPAPAALPQTTVPCITLPVIIVTKKEPFTIYSSNPKLPEIHNQKIYITSVNTAPPSRKGSLTINPLSKVSVVESNMTLLNRSLFQDGFKTAAQTGLPANGLKSVYFQDSLVITPVAPLGVFHIYQNCDPDTGARRYEISPSEGRFCARPKSELVKGEWEVLIKTSEYVEGKFGSCNDIAVFLKDL